MQQNQALRDLLTAQLVAWARQNGTFPGQTVDDFLDAEQAPADALGRILFLHPVIMDCIRPLDHEQIEVVNQALRQYVGL